MSDPTEKTLTRIRVEGFRSLRDVDLTLGRINVLIGPNGSGKSNLLSFLQLVPHIGSRTLQSVVQRSGGASALLHYGPKQTPKAHFRLEFEQDGGATAYEADLVWATGDGLFLENEQASDRAPGATEFGEPFIGTPTQESNFVELAQHFDEPELRTVAWWFRQVRSFHFPDTSPQSTLRQPAVGAQDRVLALEGRNLAAFLYRLKTSADAGDQAAWKRITGLVRRIAPSVADLAPTSVQPGEDPPTRVRLDWVDDRGETFGVQDLSDGTLRAIALVTALAQPSATLPAFIAIDEPELGLHPAAIALLAALVRSVSTRCQVLLATQSPALLDHFEPEEVIVTERIEGATTFHRLDPDALADWLAEYSLSELYDKNVLGGRP